VIVSTVATEHSGDFVRTEIIKPAGVSVTDAAAFQVALTARTPLIASSEPEKLSLREKRDD